jgi:hypothetical protein
MGSSHPLPVGFEIQFGSLNFQATGNGYLMRITNRDELRAWRSTGPRLVPVTPAVDAPAPTRADTAGPSVPQHRRRSGQRSRQARTEQRWVARVASQRDAITGETADALVRERTVSRPRFPLDFRGTTTAYVASANTDVVARRGWPGRRVLAVVNPSASTDDESYHGSASELAPATSHGYAEWDFSGVPDSVIFRWFLDAADYWFSYSDDSSVGSYDPAMSASWWSPTTRQTAQTRGPVTEKPFAARKLDYSRARGRAHPPPRQRGEPT